MPVKWDYLVYLKDVQNQEQEEKGTGEDDARKFDKLRSIVLFLEIGEISGFIVFVETAVGAK